MVERVAITGMNCISCFGIGHDVFAEAVLAGRTGIAPVTRFDTSGCHSHLAATIKDFDPAQYISPLKLRRVDAVGRIALACTRLLFDDAACVPGEAGRDDVGIAMGTCTAGLDSLVEYLDGLTSHGPAGVPAILFSNTVSNAPASLCAIEFGLRGPNVTFNQREASSLSAIAFSAAAIRSGRAKAMVTGAADCLEEIFFRVHDRFRALSPMRGKSGDHGSEMARPFDRRRNGFVLGEGGFLLYFEAASAAFARNAHIYGELLGIGGASSKAPLNGWPADGAGLASAMRRAMADAGIDAGEVAAVIASANGSPLLDKLESDAIADVFGGRRLPVASLKGAIAESSSSGAAGVIAGLRAITSQVVPPTAGLRELDPDLRVGACHGRQPADGRVFLVNSVASGGTIYSVAVRAAGGLEPDQA